MARTERQKELVAQYRKQAKTMGAYSILNTANGRRFIGVSRDIDARFNRHRFSLRTNTEDVSQALQDDWNACGAASFEFSILDMIDPPDQPGYDPTEDLALMEVLWISHFATAQPHGYNKA